MKLTKNGVVCTQKKKNRDFRCRRKFRYIAKMRYCSENSLCSEIHYKERKFGCRKNFAEIAKFSLFCSEISMNALIQFLHSWLKAIEDKSYELDVNQLNFEMPSLS